MGRAYLGVDCGTTSIKCMAVDEYGKQLHIASRVHETFSPKEGWMEQEPDGWIEPVMATIQECVLKAADYDVAAIAFSGHMSSPVFLDSNMKPVYPCMTVGDARCEDQAEYLFENYGEKFKTLTNNKPFSCFVAAKLLWFKENEPERYKRTKHFVFAKDYLRYVMTGVLNTEPTDAGNSALYNDLKGEWDWRLIETLGIKKEIFPEVMPSMKKVGTVLPEIARRCGLKQNVSVYCGGADMACSQIGTNSFSEGILAITLSTSGQVCMRIPEKCKAGYGKLTFHQSVLPNTGYAMGSIFSGGLALNWWYKVLEKSESMSKKDFEKMNLLAAESEKYDPGSKGVVFLPFLTGSGSPYFSSIDRGTFFGMSVSTNPAVAFKAVMEGVSFHIRENVEVFYDMGCPVKRICLSGGGINNKPWIQILTNVLGSEISLLEEANASTLGAALIAVASDNPEKSLKELADNAIEVVDVVKPDKMKMKQYDKLYEVYKVYYYAAHAAYHDVCQIVKKGESVE